MGVIDKEEFTAKARVEQWLNACEADAASGMTVSTSSIGDLLNNEGLVAAMNTILLGAHSLTSNADVIGKLCAILFDMYRADEPGFKECVFQLLPAMVCCYLNCLACGGELGAASKRGPCQSLEVFLLGIYNREVYDSDAGTSKTLVKFRFPSLALGSVYHDPSLLNSNMLTESALRRLETGHHVKMGPLPQVARMDSENRTSVLSAVLCCYSCHLTSYGHAALTALCVATARLASQGFPFDPTSPRRRQRFSKRHHRRRTVSSKSVGSEDDEDSGAVANEDEDEDQGEKSLSDSYWRTPRIALSPQIMLHLVSSVYYALYKGCALVARIAVDAIHKRAIYEVLPDVLMATEAVKHAIEASGGVCGAEMDSPSSPMLSALSNGFLGDHHGDTHGGSIDITANLARPRGSITQMISTKNIITNASFRTKKLPDDIPLIDPAATGSIGESSLSSITEEREEGTPGKEPKENPHKETKMGAAKQLLAQSQQILAKAAKEAKEQKNKALKIAGKINVTGSSGNSSNNVTNSEHGASVDGVGIEMTELHSHDK